jgi:hypothetical protein
MQTTSQPSLFKIAEETDTRLLLRPNPTAPLVFGAFFGGFGVLFVGLALAFMDKHPAAAGMVPLGAVALLLGLLSLKSGFLSKNQIVVDSDEKTARLTIGTGRSLTVAFESIEAILARRVKKTDKQRRKGGASRRYTYHVYQVYFVTSAGDLLMIDESTAEIAMMQRGQDLARRCGVPFVGSSMPEPAPAASGIAALVLEDPTTAPRRISCRDEGEASVYRWRRASFAPLNTLLYLAAASLLGTLLFGCYLAVREGFAEGEVGLGLALGAVGVVFVYLMFLLARYCLAGCELRIQ